MAEGSVGIDQKKIPDSAPSNNKIGAESGTESEPINA